MTLRTAPSCTVQQSTLRIPWKGTTKVSNFLQSGGAIFKNSYLVVLCMYQSHSLLRPVNTLILNPHSCRNVFLPPFHLSNASHSLIYSFRHLVCMESRSHQTFIGHLLCGRHWDRSRDHGTKENSPSFRESGRGSLV